MKPTAPPYSYPRCMESTGPACFESEAFDLATAAVAGVASGRMCGGTGCAKSGGCGHLCGGGVLVQSSDQQPHGMRKVAFHSSYDNLASAAASCHQQGPPPPLASDCHRGQPLFSAPGLYPILRPVGEPMNRTAFVMPCSAGQGAETLTGSQQGHRTLVHQANKGQQGLMAFLSRSLTGIQPILSLSVVSLLLVLLFSGLWPASNSHPDDPNPPSNVTHYTTVLITPCGNYFWHSANSWAPNGIPDRQDMAMLARSSSAADHGVEEGVQLTKILDLPSWFLEQPSGRPLELKRFRLSNSLGYEIELLSLGATITALKAPDKDGIIKDVALGFDNATDYMDMSRGWIGSTVGRVVNRIRGAEITIDGVTHTLSKNDGDNHLNGGHKGLSRTNWDSVTKNPIDGSLVFSVLSPDGDEGYPGHLAASAKFSLSPISGELQVEYSAMTTRKTPVNLANSLMVNLAGHDAGKAEMYTHFVKVNGEEYTPVRDDDLTVTGQVLPVAHTPYDLRSYSHVGRSIFKLPKPQQGEKKVGFDHNFVISANNNYSSFQEHFVARLEHRKSGRYLEVYSNQPGVQFYTGNCLPRWNEKALVGKDGVVYGEHGAVALMPQIFPDAPNNPQFGLRAILEPGQVYYHKTVYKFGTFVSNIRDVGPSGR